MRKNNPTRHILIAMFMGFIIGGFLHLVADNEWVHRYLVMGLLDLLGQLFINVMKMIVVPVIFFSIVSGACQLSDPQSLGRIGGKTIGLYLITTCIAITLAICFALLFHVGQGANLVASTSELTQHKTVSIKETILNFIPTNPVKAFTEGNIIQIIIFALLLGFAISWSGEPGKRIQNWFQDMNDVIIKFVNIVLKVTPIGVFALITKLMMTIEPHQILHIIGYFGTVIVVLFVHLIFTNSLLLKVLANYSPIHFFKKIFPVMLFAFSTSSSNATIPVTLSTLKQKLHIDNKVCGFTIPLGATINMDGTAIMQGVATIFIANLYNIDIGITGYLTVILTATLSSIGTAGIPSVGLITLTIVLQQVGLPVEGIALIIGVDRLLDMLRTAINVTGDAAVTTIVAKTEGLIEKTSNT